jgi:hypothetical protein
VVLRFGKFKMFAAVLHDGGEEAIVSSLQGAA